MYKLIRLHTLTLKQRDSVMQVAKYVVNKVHRGAPSDNFIIQWRGILSYFFFILLLLLLYLYYVVLLLFV